MVSLVVVQGARLGQMAQPDHRRRGGVPSAL